VTYIALDFLFISPTFSAKSPAIPVGLFVYKENWSFIILLLLFFIKMMYIRNTMTHIDFVSQSPWPLMAVCVGTAVVYYAAKFISRRMAMRKPIADVPHQAIPQRDVAVDYFNEWQNHIRTEVRKSRGYYCGKGGRK